MKKFILFFFISFSGFAQKTISYADLKKMVDATQSEAVTNFKNKGFTFFDSEENYVSYQKDNSSILLTKHISGSVVIIIAGKKYEYISTNILNTIKKLGYKEYGSENNDGSFCTLYYSTNYRMMFCDSIIEYDNGSNEPIYNISMDNRY